MLLIHKKYEQKFSLLQLLFFKLLFVLNSTLNQEASLKDLEKVCQMFKSYTLVHNKCCLNNYHLNTKNKLVLLKMSFSVFYVTSFFKIK